MPNYNDAQGVADHLSVVMEYADRDCEFTTYPLDEAEREALLTKMDAYCRHETGKGISEYAKEVMGEPASPVSLKAAAKEARESSAALAAHGASTIDLEHEADNAQKASETLFDADGDR